MADLEQAIRNEALPPKVKAAAEQVLKLQTPVDAEITPQTVKDAVARSGLFLEPRLARSEAAPPPDLKSALLVLRHVLRAAAPPPAPPAPATGGPPPQPQHGPAPLATTYSPPRAALPVFEGPLAPPPAAPASPASGPQQRPQPPSGAPQLAPRASGEAVPQGAPPPQARTSATAPALSQPPPQQTATPVPSRQGGEASGSAAPSQTTRPAPAAPAAPHAPATPQAPQARPAAKVPQPRGAAPPPALPLAPMSAADPDAASPQSRAAPSSAPQTAAESQETPPPPLKGATPSAQRAAQPTLGPDAAPADVLRHLEKATAGAVARTELMQLASLADAPRADGEPARTQSWLFEMPLATPQGAAVAQFEIEKDGAGAEAAREAPVWRTRFSVDVEPLGLIHALLVLAGGKTSVTLWAERASALARLRAAQGELAGSLEAEVAVHPGRPAAPRPREGRFLDASS
jgi:hypothetical protein